MNPLIEMLLYIAPFGAPMLVYAIGGDLPIVIGSFIGFSAIAIMDIVDKEKARQHERKIERIKRDIGV